MKAIYELVSVLEVKAGDIIKSYDGCDVTWAEIDCAKASSWKNDEVFRCLPATEDPRVLRRALELACHEIAKGLNVDDPAWADVFAKDRIEQANKELESEAKS
jgi:hypothetical protein